SLFNRSNRSIPRGALLRDAEEQGGEEANNKTSGLEQGRHESLHHAPPCVSIQSSRTRIPSSLEALVAKGNGIGLCSRDGLPGRYTPMRAVHRPSSSSAVNPNPQPL